MKKFNVKYITSEGLRFRTITALDINTACKIARDVVKQNKFVGSCVTALGAY